MKFARHTQDPNKVKVQLNVKVTWEFREHLFREAERRGISVNSLVNNILESSLPLHRGFDACEQ